ncbi:MAG: prepilin peptidase [Clostridiales Family XIII bacterium]|jgi:leader peptidase (prepilin peptidase)/N-methyltransferase|nr:prepilin peptidase [Clostridiales Family XIII bacterium]
MLTFIYALGIVFAFVVGAAVGSFLNVLIYRIPRGLDFTKGFSFCPSCEHRLYPRDLVPVFSYLLLGRKCRYCKTPISPRYMAVELLGGALGALSWCAFLAPVGFLRDTLAGGGNTSAAVAASALYFAALCILVVTAFIDADTMEIYDGTNIALAVCGVLAIFVGPDMPLRTHLIGIAAVSVPLFVIAFFVQGAFGLGDVLLMAAAGLFLGWQGAVVAVFVGILIGGGQGAFLLLTKKKGGKEHFAFGPALCVGIAIAMFLSQPLIDWYVGKL